MKTRFLVLAACAAMLAGAAMRPTPEYLKRATVYQIVLRNFTRDGNFKSATEMLEHVRSAGVDVVYLTPFVEMDCDMNPAGWSARQHKSGFGSPKNCYRISNYDKIDPEYGNDADFKAFNDKAHALGMKVYMDLVYLHCGPNNVMKDMFPDAFQKNPDGTVRESIWHFPYVNFKSKPVRKYLIDSMLHWMRLGCDGFRCDVGDQVPIDFWVEAVTACQKVKPDLVMINEGTKPEWLEKAFDACYAWPWSNSIRNFINPHHPGQKTATNRTLDQKMPGVRKYEASIPKNSLMFCYMDNHDSATDDWEVRFDRVMPVEAGNAAFVAMFLRRGLPLVFNGNEIADNGLNSFFAPVEHPMRCSKIIDWARALQPAGQKRLALIRKLAKLHHDDSAFYNGEMDWITDGEAAGAISFVRREGNRKVFVSSNLTPKAIKFAPKGVKLDAAKTPLLAEGFKLMATPSSSPPMATSPWSFNSRKR